MEDKVIILKSISIKNRIIFHCKYLSLPWYFAYLEWETSSYLQYKNTLFEYSIIFSTLNLLNFI